MTHGIDMLQITTSLMTVSVMGEMASICLTESLVTPELLEITEGFKEYFKANLAAIPSMPRDYDFLKDYMKFTPIYLVDSMMDFDLHNRYIDSVFTKMAVPEEYFIALQESMKLASNINLWVTVTEMQAEKMVWLLNMQPQMWVDRDLYNMALAMELLDMKLMTLGNMMTALKMVVTAMANDPNDIHLWKLMVWDIFSEDN